MTLSIFLDWFFYGVYMDSKAGIDTRVFKQHSHSFNHQRWMFSVSIHHGISSALMNTIGTWLKPICSSIEVLLAQAWGRELSEAAPGVGTHRVSCVIPLSRRYWLFQLAFQLQRGSGHDVPLSDGRLPTSDVNIGFHHVIRSPEIPKFKSERMEKRVIVHDGAVSKALFHTKWQLSRMLRI
jgi:hypothetical protein